jgi:hypothetical protein
MNAAKVECAYLDPPVREDYTGPMSTPLEFKRLSQVLVGAAVLDEFRAIGLLSAKQHHRALLWV